MSDVPQPPKTLAEFRDALDRFELLSSDEQFHQAPLMADTAKTVFALARQAAAADVVSGEGSQVAAARRLGVSKQLLHNVMPAPNGRARKGRRATQAP